MKTKGLLCLLFLGLYSCFERPLENPGKDRTVSGMRPVYKELSANSIKVSPARERGLLQNVVAFRDYILIIERFEGIHVVNNIDPSNPVNEAFWEIPGVLNFTISNNTLLAPIVDKLVAIDVTNIEDIKLLSITEDLFKETGGNFFPQNYEGSFECVDPSKGVVVAWVTDQLDDPRCWR